MAASAPFRLSSSMPHRERHSALSHVGDAATTCDASCQAASASRVPTQDRAPKVSCGPCNFLSTSQVSRQYQEYYSHRGQARLSASRSSLSRSNPPLERRQARTTDESAAGHRSFSVDRENRDCSRENRARLSSTAGTWILRCDAVRESRRLESSTPELGGFCQCETPRPNPTACETPRST